MVSNVTACLYIAITIMSLQETRRHKKHIAAHQVPTENRQKFFKDKKGFQLTTTILFFPSY